MKSIYKTILVVPFLAFTTCSQAQKVTAEAPKEQYNPLVTVEKLRSTIAVPFAISIDDIEKQLNASITDLIYEDNSHTDNDNDLLKMKVWKKAPIKFTAFKNDVFDYTVPLKVWVEKGMSVFGMTQYAQTTFEMNLKFSSKFAITPDWRMQTQTTPRGFEWITTPKIRIASFDVPITAIVGKVLQNNEALIARKIDETVADNLTLKQYALDAWNTAQKPYLASEEYNTWVKISPLEIQLTPLRTEGRDLKAKVGLIANTETITGKAPLAPPPATSLPPIRYVQDINDAFQVGLMSAISYEEATAMANKQFKGKVFEFRGGKNKIRVDNMLLYGSNDRLVIALDISGDVRGSIYIKGVPYFDEAKRQVMLKDTELDVRTRNVLVKAAAWLLEGTLERKIQTDFGMPVDELLKYGKESVEGAIRTPYMKGVMLDGQIKEIKPDRVILTEEGITAILKATGNLKLRVQGLE